MTTAKRRLGTRAFGTGPIGFEWGQSAPLVLDQEAPQLGILGSKGVDVLVAHGKDSSEPLLGSTLPGALKQMTDNPRDSAAKPCKC